MFTIIIWMRNFFDNLIVTFYLELKILFKSGKINDPWTLKPFSEIKSDYLYV